MEDNPSVDAGESDRLSRSALAATAFFGFCLALLLALVLIGLKEPKRYSSHALIESLVETKPLMKHLRNPDLLEVIRASNTGQPAVEDASVADLTRRLNLKEQSGNDRIELRATASSPEGAKRLMESWIELGRDMWPESVQETHPIYGPFLIIARSSPDPSKP